MGFSPIIHVYLTPPPRLRRTHGNECRWTREKRAFRGKLIRLRALCRHCLAWEDSSANWNPRPKSSVWAVITFCLKITRRPRMNLGSQSALIKLKRVLKTMISLTWFLFKPSRSLICHVFFRRRTQWVCVWRPLQETMRIGHPRRRNCLAEANVPFKTHCDYVNAPCWMKRFLTLSTQFPGLFDRDVEPDYEHLSSLVWATNTVVFSRAKGLARVLQDLQTTLKSFSTVCTWDWASVCFWRAASSAELERPDSPGSRNPHLEDVKSPLWLSSPHPVVC